MPQAVLCSPSRDLAPCHGMHPSTPAVQPPMLSTLGGFAPAIPYPEWEQGWEADAQGVPGSWGGQAHLPLCRMMVRYPRLGCRSLLHWKCPSKPGCWGEGGRAAQQAPLCKQLIIEKGGKKLILMHQLNKSKPVSSCCIRSCWSCGEESQTAATLPAHAGGPASPQTGEDDPLATQGPALGVLCPEPFSHPNGLCYSMVAVAASAARWDDGMG